jgi:polyhydroxyalkanoate synthase
MVGFWLCLGLVAAEAEPEVHWVQTEDAAWVALHHRPAEGPPVLLVHGISSNHFCWDLEEGRSLAKTLVAAGFDAWLLDLRGHGSAERTPTSKRQRGRWSLDDYGRYDLPAALAFVQEQTGAERVHFVGHSMGGMVVTVALSEHPSLSLNRMVIVATPMDFEDPERVPGWLLGWMRLTVGILGALPSPLGARIHAGVGSPFPVDEMLFTDISSPSREHMYRRIVSPLFGGELTQLESVIRHGAFLDVERSKHYLEGLAQVEIPTRVIAGRGDRIATPDRVYGFYTGLKKAERDFVLAGKATGFAADYGHLDLLLGDHAEEEIYPLIVEWLRMGEEEGP